MFLEGFGVSECGYRFGRCLDQRQQRAEGDGGRRMTGSACEEKQEVELVSLAPSTSCGDGE